jgi:hypothetical protein
VLKAKAKITKLGNDNGAWSIIVLTRKQVARLSPPSGCSFRIKGKLDDYPIKFKSLLPLGDGRFMLMINAEMRKGTGKGAGDTLNLAFELDTSKKRISSEFLACLKDDPAAYKFFKTLNKSNQHYFDFWIRSAKTADTKAERIALSISALASGKKYSELRRSLKTD